MENRDARTLTQDAQHEIRRQAIKLHLKGFGPSRIAEDLDVHRNAVSGWINRYKEGGMKALKIGKRGPRPGTTLQLDEATQNSIRKLLVEKNPDQLKLPFALWTREAVGLLITELTGQVLDLRQVGRYLKRWGFTPQRPIKRAYQRNEKKVEEWLETEYPAIKKQAESEGGEIHWSDEAGLKSHDHRGRGYAPKDNTPVRLHNPSYEKINMISSVTNQGKLRFMCYEGSFNQRVFHRFLSGLVRDAAGRKLHVIVDNLRVHHGKIIRRWLRRYAMFIEVHYLPSYSPDLNPDEYLNCDVKTELAKRPERRTKGKWRMSVEGALESIASQPERVASYFKSKHIQYAA
jgi:transposase